MGDWLLIPGCGVVALLLGPALAVLTLALPTAWPRVDVHLLFGTKAGRGRQLLCTVLAGALFGLLAARFGADPVLAAFLVFAAASVVLAVIDVEHHRLPDRLVVPALLAVEALLAIAAALDGDLSAWLRSLAGAAAASGGLLVLALVAPGGLGLGDVKLGALLGLVLGWLGWDHLLSGLVSGFVLGALVALALVVTRRAGLRTPIAFGPALLGGTVLTVLTGPLLAA